MHLCSLLSMDSPAVACDRIARCAQDTGSTQEDLGSCAWLSNGMDA